MNRTRRVAVDRSRSLLLACTVTAAVFVLTPAPARALTVTVPKDYTTVQEAIDAGADEILIAPGAYPETPVISNIPPGNVFHGGEYLAIRGMVPAGSPSEDLPAIDGLELASLSGKYSHAPTIVLSDVRFTQPVRTTFHSAPYSNPLAVTFHHCVLERGLHDSTATAGGLLDYGFLGCTIDGPISIHIGEAVFVDSSLVHQTLTIGTGGEGPLYMGSVRHSVFSGSGDIAIDLRALHDGFDVTGNHFEGFTTPIRAGADGFVGQLDVRDNQFPGPGRSALEYANGLDFNFIHNTVHGFVAAVWHNPDLGAEGGRLVEASNNTVEQCNVTGLDLVGLEVTAAGNVLRTCGAGIAAHSVGAGWAFLRSNQISECEGDGLLVHSRFAEVTGNTVGRCGGVGIRAEIDATAGEGDPDRVQGNTSYLNGGSGYVVRTSGEIYLASLIDHNIAYRNGGPGLSLSPNALPYTLGCNDWFQNDSSAVDGAPVAATDLAVDPLFCDAASDSVALHADSPLLDAAGCGRIGAHGAGCESTPVLLSQFVAERVTDGVRVRWMVESPQISAVALERAEAREGPWGTPATELSGDGRAVVALDRSALADRGYWYRLVGHLHGAVAVLGAPIAAPALAATVSRLRAVGPNPAAGDVTIAFDLAREGRVGIEVLDLQGRTVAVLARGTFTAGAHAVRWSAQHVPGGVYFVRYRYPGGDEIRRVVRVS